MYRNRPPAPRPGVGLASALERVYEAGQGLLVERVEVLIAEWRRVLGHTLVALAGVLVAGIGWVLWVSAALEWFEPGTPRRIAEFAIGALHLVGGALLARHALHSAKDETQ